MNIVRLYADLQLNPDSYATYKNISKYYKSIGKEEICLAFEHLIETKFNDRTHINKKQSEDSSQND